MGRSRQITVEKLSTVVNDIRDEWQAAYNILQQIIHAYEEGYVAIDIEQFADDYKELRPVMDFLEEFRVESKRTISVNVLDIEPRTCGSCHMLAKNYDGGPSKTNEGYQYFPKNLKCVYQNGPTFDFGSPAKWFKVCEYYIRRTD